MSVHTYVISLSDGQQKLIREKLNKIAPHFSYLTESENEMAENGMCCKLCDLEEVIDVRRFLNTGRVKGNPRLLR